MGATYRLKWERKRGVVKFKISTATNQVKKIPSSEAKFTSPRVRASLVYIGWSASPWVGIVGSRRKAGIPVLAPILADTTKF